ncbi:MAG: pyridoxal 5'-phosphate synthase glutaminase subunit PdxT, partial [Candidatus Lokiarchaeota archaeon]|nr:pyridoxal 5'-phosphate synthase glutaminase subunit PdxT [Candidatus Lokiarchaeota archaeon]
MTREELKRFAEKKYIWGTCAGMILVANKVDDPKVDNLGFIDIHVQRNAYGRQIDSFTVEQHLPFIDGKEDFK